ncbi:hatching enzyme 1.2-like [Clavelina lepadiformis]|uniref:Metalloendopeptidase n=1 Tax=Clavelina lepadiformis TaxID=159417 RepID=A0ABP0FZW3_CLALP
MVQLTVLLLVCGITAHGVTSNRSSEDITSLEMKLLDLLKEQRESKEGATTCLVTDKLDLNVDGEETPSPIEVNECGNVNQQNAELSCSDFDESQCGEANCVLGFETDEMGCVISCNCKSKGLLQGDIMLSEEDTALLQMENAQSVVQDRAASRFKRRWNTYSQTDGTYVVPYTIDASIQQNPRALAAVSAAIQQYAEDTCIRFKPRKNEKDYLEFFVGRGCWSYIGRIRGKQQLSVGNGCEWKGVVMHEMMHAMGFFHEHSRPDRDDTVKIVMENINPRMKFNFKKMSSFSINSMNSPYDITSVMQYGGYSFSINRQPTILEKKTGKPVVAQRRGFSVEDKKQINGLFKCNVP